MIDIKYENGGIKINTGNLEGIYNKNQLPLKFEVIKSVSKEVVWTTDLNSNMWATYPDNEMHDVIVKDNLGKLSFTYCWDAMLHGSIFYKSLYLFCLNIIQSGKIPEGLVIGTHDGEFGEWVPVIIDQLSTATLVEGSRLQFEKLTENYKNKTNIHPIFDIITTDGENVEFFEGGRGYTNSVVERVIKNWETEPIKSSLRQSTSINELIKENLNGHIDWLHLDVEGLDAQLIMSLEEKFIPNFIIFEDYNLTHEEKFDITKWLTDKGFHLHSEGGICLVNKSS